MSLTLYLKGSESARYIVEFSFRPKKHFDSQKDDEECLLFLALNIWLSLSLKEENEGFRVPVVSPYAPRWQGPGRRPFSPHMHSWDLPSWEPSLPAHSARWQLERWQEGMACPPQGRVPGIGAVSVVIEG